MRTTLILTLTAFLSSSFAQTLSNEREYYHYKKSSNELLFTSDTNTIISTSAYEDDFIWNLDNVDTKSTINTYRYGESMMNADGTGICTVGGQYYNPETKEVTSASLSFYSVKTKKTTVKKFEKLNLQRMCFHPTDSNMIGVIGMDEDFNYRAALMDRTNYEIQEVLFQGKGSVIPLWMQFDQTGERLFIGYGNSSYNGGFSVFDMKTKKEIKRISLKDQPKEFLFLDDGKTVVRGNKLVFLYDTHWIEYGKHPIRLAAIHPSGKYGIHFNSKKEAFFYFFESKTKIKLDLPILLKQDFSNVNEFHGYAKFSPNGKQLAIKYYKWHSGKTQTTSEFPSFMVYDILAE